MGYFQYHLASAWLPGPWKPKSEKAHSLVLWSPAKTTTAVPATWVLSSLYLDTVVLSTVVLLCSWVLWYSVLWHFSVVRYCGGPSGMAYIWIAATSGPIWGLLSLYIGWVLFWVPICTVGGAGTLLHTVLALETLGAVLAGGAVCSSDGVLMPRGTLPL